MVRIPQARTYEVAGRVDRWERHNARALIELACDVRSDAPFSAREVNLQLQQVHLAHVSATPHQVTRDDQVIAGRPADSIVVYAGLRGDALVETGGLRTVVHPGQLLVCDADKPLVRGFGHGLEELAIKVPRTAFEALTGTPSLAAPLLLDARGRGYNAYARALVRVVGRAVAAAVPVPADEQAVLELVAVLATGGRATSPLAHSAAARAFIDDHLTDPGLSATAVAAGANISERHLSRLFADAGTSVPRHILARRLDLAHTRLAHDFAQGLRVADIASMCGFTSVAHFSASFRRRFGTTPAEVRRACVEDSPGSLPPPAPA